MCTTAEPRALPAALPRAPFLQRRCSSRARPASTARRWSTCTPWSTRRWSSLRSGGGSAPLRWLALVVPVLAFAKRRGSRDSLELEGPQPAEHTMGFLRRRMAAESATRGRARRGRMAKAAAGRAATTRTMSLRMRSSSSAWTTSWRVRPDWLLSKDRRLPLGNRLFLCSAAGFVFGK